MAPIDMSSAFADNSDDWPPPGCPPLAWPALHRPEDRLAWYLAVIGAYAALWDGHVTQPRIAAVDEAAVAALEARLGCALPDALRVYHLRIGALSLSERLCGVDAGGGSEPIQPLLEAYPGIPDISDDPAELESAEHMVAFSECLGQGNYFCFHRETGAVHYFDHDEGPMLTRFFPSPEPYLDALMMLCLGEVHQCEEDARELLAERWGRALVTKWLY